MTKYKIIGTTLVAFPDAVLNFLKKNNKKSSNNYKVYFWLDEEDALYLKGNTAQPTAFGFYGIHAKQIGSQYYAGLESVLKGKSLLEAIQDVKNIQINSPDFVWHGSMDELLELVGLAKEEEDCNGS